MIFIATFASDMTSDGKKLLHQMWEEAVPVPVDEQDGARAAISRARASSARALSVTASIAAVFALAFVIFSLSLSRTPVTLAAADAKAQYTLPDGTVVWLNRGTTLSYSKAFGKQLREVQLEGEAYFDVTHDPEHPFVVCTPEVDVTVLGTRFQVSAYPDAFPATYLEEGSVKASGRNLEETVLCPGESLSFDGTSWSVRPFNPQCHLGWTGESLVMVNMPLLDVVTSLEHWYSVKLSVASPEEAAREKLSMTVRGETLACLVHGLDYEPILETINLISKVKVSL